MKVVFRAGLLAMASIVFTGPVKAETCTLKTYAASWMVTGTPFSIECASGTYSGHLVTTPARRFLRRGHMMLVFEQPVAVVPRKDGDEGKIEPSRTHQVTTILMGGGVAVGSKDLVDGIAGAAFKSWYMIPISGAAFALFSNGGDVLLKPGYELQILSTRAGDDRQEQPHPTAPSNAGTALHTPDGNPGLSNGQVSPARE